MMSLFAVAPSSARLARRHLRARALLVALLLVAQAASPGLALAQEAAPPAAGAPAPVPAAPTPTVTAPEPAPVPPAAPAADGLTFDFQDAPLQAVLNYLSEAAGVVVVSNIPLQGRISLISRRPISAQEAVDLLNTLLKENGYCALLMGRTLKIVALTDAKQQNVPVSSGADPQAITPSDRVITQIIPLRSVDAVKLRDNLVPLLPPYADLQANAASNSLLLTDTEANIRRIVEIVYALDSHMSATADVRVFQLSYARATNVARIINDVFKQDTPTQQPGGGGMRRFGPPGQQGQQGASQEAGRSQKITASADDLTNTVVVTGSPDSLELVAQVVKELDSNPSSEQGVLVYRLSNGNAANLVTVLNNLFTNRSTTARGGAQQGGFGGRMSGQTTTAVQSTMDLAGQVYVVADADTNSLLVMTASKNFDRVRSIIAKLDEAVPEVLIKVLIAEVTHTDNSDLGAEFAFLDVGGKDHDTSVGADFSVAAQKGGLTVNITTSNFEATLRALEESGKLEILSRPYILASDNQEASITVGAEVPFITNSRTTDAGQTINTIQYQDIGIILNVTPHINPQGLVILDVAPEVSSLTGESVPISETVSAPVFAKRSAQSRVAVRDGQTVVIGGLMEDKKTTTDRKVPILGDLPLLGPLFRRSIKEKAKTELLIFLTPHVALNPDSLEGMSDGEVSGSTLLPHAVAPGAFQQHLKNMCAPPAPATGTAGQTQAAPPASSVTIFPAPTPDGRSAPAQDAAPAAGEEESPPPGPGSEVPVPVPPDAGPSLPPG